MIHAGVVTLFQGLKRNHAFDIGMSDRFNFVVLPWHLDLNFHLNNAYYLKFCNQARFVFLAKYKIFPVLLRERMAPVISKTEIRYFRSLNLFDSFTIETMIEDIKPSSILMKQTFRRGHDKIAELESTVKLVRKGGRVDHVELFNKYFKRA